MAFSDRLETFPRYENGRSRLPSRLRASRVNSTRGAVGRLRGTPALLGRRVQATRPDRSIWRGNNIGQFLRGACGRSAFCESEFVLDDSVCAANVNDFPGPDLHEGQSKGRKVYPEVFKAIGG